MPHDLRDWLDRIQSLDLLRKVRSVDWDQEVGAIADLNVKRNKYTLLFDEIKDSPKGFRILTGALIDAIRLSVTLGLPETLTNLELVQHLREKLASQKKNPEGTSPKWVKNAPLFENAWDGDAIDLFRFPSPRWFEGDGGRYMGTGDAVVTRDPETGWVNVGSYRMMLQDKKTLSLFLEGPRHARFMLQKYWDQGEPAPIAVSFGHHPLIMLSAGLEVPSGVSEYNTAGALMDTPYPVVKGPLTGLPLPADSEIAIEGYVYQEPSSEGPFGEFLGYYSSGTTQSPTVKVEAVYHRDDPIMLGACVGKPPHDTIYFRCPMRAAMIWDFLEQAGVDGIKGVWCHEPAYSRAFTVVSLQQMFAGHARMAGYLACQCKPGNVTGKYVVVVDEDIDPSNLDDVVWALSSRSDPATGIATIGQSLGTPLDPIADHSPDKDILEYTSSRAIIFAVKPFGRLLRNEFPRVVEPNQEVKARILEQWSEIFSD